MQRRCATLALFGYLLGGMLLPAMHRYGLHAHSHQHASGHLHAQHHEHASHHHHAGDDEHASDHRHVAEATSDGPCETLCDGSHSAVAAATGFHRPVHDHAHACDGACLLCQLGSQAYIAKATQRSHSSSDQSTRCRLPKRQTPPPSERRGSGYLRGPPTLVS